MSARSENAVEGGAREGAENEAAEIRPEAIEAEVEPGERAPSGSAAIPPDAAADLAAGTSDLAAGTSDLAAVRDRWLRAEAEVQNVRRRAGREREELRRELEDQWLLEVAGLLEDLERGLSAARAGGAPENWTRGFELAGQRLHDLLDRHGVSVVDPAGQPFDPRLHEALLEVDAPAGGEAGRVAHVVARGYARNGRSLRAAQVAVTRAPSGGESPA